MSRRKRNFIFALVLLVIATFILLDRSRFCHRAQNPSDSNGYASTSDIQKYHGRSFIVIKVVDGDTIDIDYPDGKYNQTRIRLWGIDTPETKNPKTGKMYFGPEAATFTTKLTLGKKVIVYLDKDNSSRGKYGRLLAYVQLPDGRFLNEVLLTEGFAYADLRFKHSFYNKYKQLESVAHNQKRGLWQLVTHEQLPKWLQRKKPNLVR